MGNANSYAGATIAFVLAALVPFSVFALLIGERLERYRRKTRHHKGARRGAFGSPSSANLDAPTNASQPSR
jgi:hypothetical protein